MLNPTPLHPTELIAAAGGVYLTGEDNFRLTSWASGTGLVLTLEGRLVAPDGGVTPFKENHVPNSDRTPATSIYPAREGLLTNVQVRVANTTVVTGSCAALLEIVRGREGTVIPFGTLLQGYVTSGTRLAWPAPASASLIAGGGRLRFVTGTDPAAGVEISEVVPTGARWRLRSIRFAFVASAAAANRRPVLTIDDTVSPFWETSSAVDVTANQTATYNAAPGVPFFTYGTLAYHLPLPAEVVLVAGGRIRTVTTNLQGGDNYGAPTLMVEEWLEQ